MGKSSLINFILGDDVCEVKGPGDGQTLERVTTEVKGSQVKMNGVVVKIYDSPGLQDGTPDEPRYLAEMYEKCRDADLVFYCLEMTMTRWTPPEIKSIQLLTDTFGGTFWDKAIFVLTKGNMVESPHGDAYTREYFNNAKKVLGKQVRAEVTKQVSRPEVKQRPKNVDAIPAVPAGSKRKQVLPDGKHFIGHIWLSCLERIRLEKVDCFMDATCSDFRIVSHKDIKPKSGRWLGFIPSKEDIRNAWRAVFKRANKPTSKRPAIRLAAKQIGEPGPIPEVATRDGDEPKYLLYMDKDDCERLKNIKIPKGKVATLKRMFSKEILMQ